MLLFLPFQPWNYKQTLLRSAFLHGLWGSSSGPHPYQVSVLLTKLSLPEHMLWRGMRHSYQLMLMTEVHAGAAPLVWKTAAPWP